MRSVRGSAATALVSEQKESLPLSALQLGPILELGQRFGIRERFDVPHGQAMHDIAHRQLDDLAVFVRGMSVTCTIRAGTWRGVAFGADRAGGCAPPAPSSSATTSRRRTNSTTRTSLLASAGRSRATLDHLVELLDLAVDFRRADAHAAGIEHGVRAAVDDQPVVLGELD